jgi:hypothetical protein
MMQQKRQVAKPRLRAWQGKKHSMDEGGVKCHVTQVLCSQKNVCKRQAATCRTTVLYYQPHHTTSVVSMLFIFLQQTQATQRVPNVQQEEKERGTCTIGSGTAKHLLAMQDDNRGCQISSLGAIWRQEEG